MKSIEESDGSRIGGVPCGFGELDEMLNGFQRGEMLILAARPSIDRVRHLRDLCHLVDLVHAHDVCAADDRSAHRRGVGRGGRDRDDRVPGGPSGMLTPTARRKPYF